MRFLFGIVSGAGAVLALALAAGVDRDALLVEAREALTEARGVAAAWLEGWRGSEPIPPAPRVDPVPEPRAEPKAQPKAERDPEPAALPENVLPELPEAVTVDLLAELEAAPASAPAPGMQPVWVPFRSERSATGFAERLAARLDHPFEVRRRGPGVYEVAFAYGGEAERAQLLERVRAATGAAP